MRCQTIGCTDAATGTITYPDPAADSGQASDRVCGPCGTGYASRPALGATYVPDVVTVTVTRVRWYDRDVADGALPPSAYDGARHETTDGATIGEAVRMIRDEGATEWSDYPAREYREHGWFSSPDGAREVWGGDEYDPGHDREETTVRVTGAGAAVVWAHIVNGTDPADD